MSKDVKVASVDSSVSSNEVVSAMLLDILSGDEEE